MLLLDERSLLVETLGGREAFSPVCTSWALLLSADVALDGDAFCRRCVCRLIVELYVGAEQHRSTSRCPSALSSAWESDVGGGMLYRIGFLGTCSERLRSLSLSCAFLSLPFFVIVPAMLSLGGTRTLDDTVLNRYFCCEIPPEPLDPNMLENKTQSVRVFASCGGFDQCAPACVCVCVCVPELS